MRRSPLIILAICGACTARTWTRLVVPYRSAEPLDRVTVAVANATGEDLPMPPFGLVGQAVEFMLKQPPATSTIGDAFANAAADRLARMNVHVEPAGAASETLLRITLHEWHVRDRAATDAVVFVSADYALLDKNGGLLWEVAHNGLAVPFDGPYLTRWQVERIASRCVDLALASLPPAPSGHAQ